MSKFSYLQIYRWKKRLFPADFQRIKTNIGTIEVNKYLRERNNIKKFSIGYHGYFTIANNFKIIMMMIMINNPIVPCYLVFLVSNCDADDADYYYGPVL